MSIMEIITPSMLQQMENIFGREQEMYRPNSKNGLATGVWDFANSFAMNRNDRANEARKKMYGMEHNTGVGNMPTGSAEAAFNSMQPQGQVLYQGKTPTPQQPLSFGNILNQNSVDDAWNNQKSFYFPAADNTPTVSGNLSDGVSKYLGDEYRFPQWLKDDRASGVTDPVISVLRYGTQVAPLVQAAKEDDMRNAFMTYNNANSTPEQKMDAIAKLAYYTKTPDLADRIQRGHDNDMYRQGYVRDNSDIGSNILSAFKDYEEGEQWMSPDGTGDSRTQCSNFVSNVLRKVGLNIGHPNGDELMKQFGKAYHTGLDGIQAGDVLNFKDHVGFYVGNGKYIARNSSGGVHEGTMEEAVRLFGQPLGYASVREYAAGVPRYTKDTSKESLLRQRHQYDMEKIAAQNAYRINARNSRQNGINGTKIKEISPEDAEQAVYDYADSEAPTFKQGHQLGQAWAQDFADYAKEYGDLGQAARQMYYDYAAMSPEERGWSMSSEKLALGVGYALAHAKGLQGMQASKEAKKVMDYLLNNQTNNQTSTEEKTQSGEKKKGKITAPKSDKFKDPNAPLTREQLVNMGVVDSDGGATSSGTTFNQMMQKKHPILPSPEFSPQHDENLTLRKIFG